MTWWLQRQAPVSEFVHCGAGGAHARRAAERHPACSAGPGGRWVNVDGAARCASWQGQASLGSRPRSKPSQSSSACPACPSRPAPACTQKPASPEAPPVSTRSCITNHISAVSPLVLPGAFAVRHLFPIKHAAWCQGVTLSGWNSACKILYKA